MKHAAERAPIWVIAVMAHVLLAVVFSMAYVRSEAVAAQRVPRTTLAPVSVDVDKLSDPIAVELPPRFPTLAETDDPVLPWDGCTIVAPDADVELPPALADGSLSLSRTSSASAGGDGGEGLPGAIGVGPKSKPGGGGRLGTATQRTSPNARTLRSQPFRPKVEAMLDGGLRWLRDHQSEDGAWDCDGFALRCDPRRGAPCTGAGSSVYDTGVTGLALLAFLGAGFDGSRQSPNDDVVRAGLKWLRNSQDAEGCYGPRTDRFTYGHACATIAMCEAATFNRSVAWRKSAQHAVDFILACRNPRSGWRYGVRPRDTDASVTGWMLLALKAGKDAGLVVDERAIADGLQFLDSITDSLTGRTGYVRLSEVPVRPPGFVDRWPAEASESLTAVALCSRIFLGREEGNSLTKAGAALIAKKPPVWDDERGTIDMYYWYYGTLAMHQLGGPAWERWNESLEKAVISTQIREGCTEGSWDPKDPWGAEGGRVYATAMMTLCLEVYWRYPLVFGGR